MSETPSPEPQKPLRRPEVFSKIKEIFNRKKAENQEKQHLKPFQIKLLKSFNPEDIVKPIPIRFFLNELTNFPHDDEFAESTEIDIMFGGSPEKNKPKTQAATELAAAYSTA